MVIGIVDRKIKSRCYLATPFPKFKNHRFHNTASRWTEESSHGIAIGKAEINATEGVFQGIDNSLAFA